MEWFGPGLAKWWPEIDLTCSKEFDIRILAWRRNRRMKAFDWSNTPEPKRTLNLKSISNPHKCSSPWYQKSSETTTSSITLFESPAIVSSTAIRHSSERGEEGNYHMMLLLNRKSLSIRICGSKKIRKNSLLRNWSRVEWRDIWIAYWFLSASRIWSYNCCASQWQVSLVLTIGPNMPLLKRVLVFWIFF